MFGSYSLIDAIYPVGFLLLWRFQGQNLLEEFENILIETTGNEGKTD